MQDASFFRRVTNPTLPSVLLRRTALVAQLQEAIVPHLHANELSMRYKLVLCCAPAGYGKTTLLADFARSTPLACCWYFLDHTDTDPTVFLRTLLASVRHTFPQFGMTLDPLFANLHPEDPALATNLYISSVETLCTALTTEISERFVLIFCNYEEINESATLTDLINFLLKKLPPQATLIIESRVVPDISFASLVIHDEMCGLDSEALRFSAQDIAELAQLQGLPALTAVEAEQLATSFDGWIAGILLGTRVGDTRLRFLTQNALHNERLPSLQAKSLAEHKRKTLFTYVVNDVLKQDTAIYAFLQTISILQQIEPMMCNDLLAITNAAEHLIRLEHQGFFLSSYESTSGPVYTCHPVIRDLLSEQLRHREPERFVFLHRQAATLWHARHNDEQTMYHALAIEDYDIAVSLILEASELLLQQGQRETIQRWLHTLPATLQESHPRLLLLQATIALERGQHDVALPLLTKAEALVPTPVDLETRPLQASIMILRSKALCQTGQYAQAETLCQQILLHLPKQEQALRAAAEMRLGICANLQGQFAAGITHLQQALHTWANHPPLSQAIDIHNALANTYYLIGSFPLAQHHLTKALDACEQLQDIPGKGSALSLRGLIAQDQGLGAEAEAAFLQALALARTVPHAQRGEAYALVNLGSLYVEQGQYAQALTYSEEGLTLARKFGNRSLANAALADLALSYLFLGDAASALFTVEQMETQAPSAGTVGYERAWHDLTYGMILLVQHRYPEATRCLTEIETALRTTNFKRGYFQAKLRLAACWVAQERTEQAISLLKEVASLLMAHPTYTHLVQSEWKWLPDVLLVVQNHSELAALRAQLGMVEPLHTPKQPEPPRVHLPLAEPHSSKLTAYAFGEPSVLLDGQPVKRWRMARAMELFFFLLDQEHPISKESILTALWPEYDEQTTQVFHNTVYYLRKLLGEACVVFRAAGYRLDLAVCYGEQVWYDVQIFQQQRLEAEQALALGNQLVAKEAFLKMVQLYRGDYGRSFYSDWCTFRRDELRAAYLEARRQLAQIAWNAEAWSESAEHWRHMLRLDNCLEEAHYGLMRCYVRQGKRGAALRQYQACQEILEDELGVQPGQAMQHLYQRLTTRQSAE